MPEIDLTISISVILAVCAIISPIATTLINNRYQLKLKDLEYQQKEKESSFFYRRGVYEDYLRCTGKCIAHPTRENIQEYGKIYALALIYFPENLIADAQQPKQLQCLHYQKAYVMRKTVKTNCRYKWWQ